MAFQLVRDFFGQSSPSRSGAYEPVVESESFGNQGGTAHYDTRDVGRTAKDSNWLELAWHDKETNGQKGRKPHNNNNNRTYEHRLKLLSLKATLAETGL